MSKKKLSGLDATARYSPIRQAESSPAERVMRETGKYCKIDCHTTQKKWPELIPKIESWLNTTSGLTGFTPVDLMFNDIRSDVFNTMLNKKKEKQSNEELQDKITLAYLTMKKAAKRKRRQLGSAKWEPELNKVIIC